MSARVLVIDHADSFVFVLGEQFSKLGAEVKTYRSDIGLERLRAIIASLDPDLVVLSPGPGRPEHAGVTVPWLRTQPEVAVLGICLGHQALAVAFGGSVGRAPCPVHGKSATIELSPDPLHDGLPETMRVARYHSLVVDAVPESFSVTARTSDQDKLVMAMRHRELPYTGLQFHPESILTPHGGRLIERILRSATTRTLSQVTRP